MFFVSSLPNLYWSQVLGREWKCSWSSADIWMINTLIVYKSKSYIRDLTVHVYYSVIHKCNGISNHVQLDCWLNSFFRLITETTPKLCITGPLWGESTGHRWIPHTKGQQCGMHFQVMIPSCIYILEEVKDLPVLCCQHCSRWWPGEV